MRTLFLISALTSADLNVASMAIVPPVAAGVVAMATDETYLPDVFAPRSVMMLDGHEPLSE